MSPADKKKLRESFINSAKARPDADKCVYHRYKYRNHFLPENWDKPCTSVKDYYTEIANSGELEKGVDRALAHIHEWKKQDASAAKKEAAAKKKQPPKKPAA